MRKFSKWPPKYPKWVPKYPKMAPSREREMMWKPFFSAVTMKAILETFVQNFIRKYWRVLRKYTWLLEWGTNVVNTKTPETYILDHLEKYRTLTFQTLEIMFHVVISRLHLQISKIGPAQQTFDQKLTLWRFDQVCVEQIYLTTFKVSVVLLDGTPI